MIETAESGNDLLREDASEVMLHSSLRERRSMEVRGIEPLSEKRSKGAATRLVLRLGLAPLHAGGQACRSASVGDLIRMIDTPHADQHLGCSRQMKCAPTARSCL